MNVDNEGDAIAEEVAAAVNWQQQSHQAIPESAVNPIELGDGEFVIGGKEKWDTKKGNGNGDIGGGGDEEMYDNPLHQIPDTTRKENTVETANYDRLQGPQIQLVLKDPRDEVAIREGEFVIGGWDGEGEGELANQQSAVGNRKETVSN